MTLLELIVVIALLGLALAVAAPAFVVPHARRSDDLASVLSTARRVAVLRGQPVTLAVDSAGSWILHGDAAANDQPIASGTLESSRGQLRVRVSALGVCIPEAPASGQAADWGGVACSPSPGLGAAEVGGR